MPARPAYFCIKFSALARCDSRNTSLTATNISMRVDQLIAPGIKGRNPRRQLASVLDIEQHSRQQAGRMLRPLLGAQRTDRHTG